MSRSEEERQAGSESVSEYIVSDEAIEVRQDLAGGEEW